MKRVLKILSIVALLMLVGVVAVFVLMGGPQSLSRRWRFDALVKTNDHDAVLRSAISFLGTITNDATFAGDKMANLPAPIAAMKPAYVAISSNRMKIEFHGGFDHFGFEITDEGDRCELSSFGEHEHHTLLVLIKPQNRTHY